MTNFIRSAFDRLCGICHAHGNDPRLADGKCQDCDRTPEQIFDAHGVVLMSDTMKCVVFARKVVGTKEATTAEMVELVIKGTEK